ncbi:MAG: hypothetical protein C0404_08575 [Verrucomicrobia bacterium]|nr:hypothetical protein [Verrucomicrobiota bacterium]
MTFCGYLRSLITEKPDRSGGKRECVDPSVAADQVRYSWYHLVLASGIMGLAPFVLFWILIVSTVALCIAKARWLSIYALGAAGIMAVAMVLHSDWIVMRAAVVAEPSAARDAILALSLFSNLFFQRAGLMGMMIGLLAVSIADRRGKMLALTIPLLVALFALYIMNLLHGMELAR